MSVLHSYYEYGPAHLSIYLSVSPVDLIPFCNIQFDWLIVSKAFALTSKLLLLSSPSGFSGVHVTQSSAYRCLSFFILATVLCVLLRFTATDYTFGIFKFFLWMHDASPVKLNPTRNYSVKHFCYFKVFKATKIERQQCFFQQTFLVYNLKHYIILFQL